MHLTHLVKKRGREFLLLLSWTLWLLLASSQSALAKSSLEDLIGFDDFRSLAIELSTKVNLFQAAWALDPKAEFFGGTSRDYLYWLRGQFQNLHSKEEVAAKVRELRETDLIDAKLFIIGQSDVDVVSDERALLDLAKHYKFKKIDMIPKNRFIPGSPEEISEKNQGYIPVEKIRLGSSGFLEWKGFGDGLREIYEGRPTAHFSKPEILAKTIYARQKKNHMLFLPLRYARILAVNYFYLYGRDYPVDRILFDIHPSSADQMLEAVKFSLSDPELENLLQNEEFQKKTNELVHKIFRSFTNPTAGKKLYEHFGFEPLHIQFPQKIETTNQYLFAQPPLDDAEVENRIREAGFFPADVLIPAEQAFPNLAFFHGVKAGKIAYRDILLRGALPSDATRNAGSGLYGVNEPNIEHAIKWCGSKELVVRMQVNPNARIVDISQGKGEELFRKYGRTEDQFAEHFGIQILKYPYPDFPAYVAKDSSALGRPIGLTQTLFSLPKLFESAKKISSLREALNFFKDSHTWELSPLEVSVLKRKYLLPWTSQETIHLDSFGDINAFLDSSTLTLLAAAQLKEFKAKLKTSIYDFISNRASAEEVQELFRQLIFEPIRESPQTQTDSAEMLRKKVRLFVQLVELQWPEKESQFRLYLSLLSLFHLRKGELKALPSGPAIWEFVRNFSPSRFESDELNALRKLAASDKKQSRRILSVLKELKPSWKNGFFFGKKDNIFADPSFLGIPAFGLIAIGLGIKILITQSPLILPELNANRLAALGLIAMGSIVFWGLSIFRKDSRSDEHHHDALLIKNFADSLGLKCSRRIQRLAEFQHRKNQTKKP